MSIEPEGAPEMAANVAASAAKDAKPAGLTADTVPRFFNWGAFLIPVPWCLAHRQWLWALIAAAPALVFAALMLSRGVPPPPGVVVYFVVFVGVVLVTPVWLSGLILDGIVCAIWYSIAVRTGAGSAPTVPWGFLSWLIPLVVSLYLGFAGNKLAARSRAFGSAVGFKAVQRRWAVLGLLISPITFALFIWVIFPR